MNHEILKNTIATLEKLRDVHCSQLDACVLAELEDVLQQLRSHLNNPVKRGIRFGDLIDRFFRIIDIALRMITNIDHWMK